MERTWHGEDSSVNEGCDYPPPPPDSELMDVRAGRDLGDRPALPLTEQLGTKRPREEK